MNMEVIKSPGQKSAYVFELLHMREEERSSLENVAVSLHIRLVADREMVVVGIMSMCRDLKDIRDGKYYEALGFADFGEYTEQMHGIGARQAYNYIRVYEKLGAEFLNLNSKIGVTKLLELASLDTEERQEFLTAHPIEELEDMSAAEVKRLTEQIRKLEKQISFLEQSAEQTENQYELREEIESELRIEYDERMSEVRLAANQEKINALAEQRDEISNLKAELKQAKSDVKANVEAVKQAEERAKTAEEKAAQINEFEFKFKNAEAEKAELEKKLKLSSDPTLTYFKFLFDSWQGATAAMFQQLDKLEPDMQAKMLAAVRAVLGDRL